MMCFRIPHRFTRSLSNLFWAGWIVLALLFSGPVAAEPSPPSPAQAKLRFVPTLALEIGQYAERLKIDLGSTTQGETRSLWNTRVALGLQYALPDSWLPVGTLRGQSSLGLGLVYAQGQWPLQLRQEALFWWSATSWLALQGGVGTGFQINVSELSRSYWEVGLALGLCLFELVELLYYPSVTVGLGGDEQQVFGGERHHGVDRGLAPLNLVLRMRFDGWGF